jgi:hypothetical protein
VEPTPPLKARGCGTRGNPGLFDLIVAENGALIYDPRSREEIPLAAPLSVRFAERLREPGVAPLEEGYVRVATRDPYGQVMLEVIRELGLEIHVIFNRGAAIALPPGINKATAEAVRAARPMAGSCVSSLSRSVRDRAFLRGGP